VNTLSCIIVEDEPHALQLLQDYISKVPFLELKASLYDAFEALEFLKQQRADVIFLDINMPQLTGLEMAAVLPPDQKIIFTTAYSQYALDSFDYHVIDYLLKPITFKRFMQAVHKLQTLSKPASPEKPVNQEDYLFVKSGRHIHKIQFDSIGYLEALKEYVSIHTAKEKFLVYKRMKEMAQALPPQFVRIHNSYIINIKHIRQMDNHLVEIMGRQLPVSSGYREGFRQKIQNHLV
jgi:DNA-binding LytR/AlgR family response regulator